ncbi:MAG: filamentous hemagglutinin N-terminal domain-containing protein [Leptolyngbyaceae cyanobacterium RU_5_1]|nr:filamentous hemagglutinin N-terminal domain-containing protein [Leptolyngbyaceae cyanobacterium RU_5_1]
MITEGTTRGSNLFHSFRQFSLPNEDFAGFITTPAIQNVIVRVTGVGSPFISNINGTIATSNPANFFLLNPNGIVFGPGATLNIGGSFLATTANAIQFGNQGFYSATNPEAPPLLTVNPSALWFNQAASGAIAVQSATSPGPNLQVPNGRSLVLVGGDISVNGGRLSAPGGQVELLSITDPGTVALNNDGTSLSLNAPVDMARSDIRFENGAGVDVRADGGGSITLDGRNIEVLGGSFLFAGIALVWGRWAVKRGILRSGQPGQSRSAAVRSNL